MTTRDSIYNVLFLGSGNFARSIMAEAILNREGAGKFRACSAGLLNGNALDPQAVDLLARMHFNTGVLRAKSWNELAGDDAPTFDFIFSVCDEATLLPRAIWRGHPMFAHWGVYDPAKAAGNPSQVRLAYADTFRMLTNRIGIFVNLPLAALDKLAMQRQLDTIGGKADAPATAAA